MATQWKVYTQDAYNLPGCLPEGYGPETNGDTFDTREEAIADAQGMLKATFEDIDAKEIGVKQSDLTMTWLAASEELETLGETGVELPSVDEETGEVDTNGYRYVSFSVEPEEI